MTDRPKADADDELRKKNLLDLVEYCKTHNLRLWAANLAATLNEHAELPKLKQRVQEAEAANEMDRTRVARALTRLNAAIMSRSWVLEGGGPYEWDDDDYRAEFSLWVSDVQTAAAEFARIAHDWHGCPMDQTEIRHARAMLEEQSCFKCTNEKATYDTT